MSREIVKIIREICKEEKIDFKSFSSDYILKLEKNQPTLVNKVINIASSVNQITLKSSGNTIKQNLRFVVESRTTPLTILFWDMKFKAHPDYNAIYIYLNDIATCQKQVAIFMQ